MPEPEINGVEIEEHAGGGFTVYTYGFFFGRGNMPHRRARAKAIYENLVRNRWCCNWCGEPVPTFRRADARYCTVSCRKKAARRRKGLNSNFDYYSMKYVK